MTPLKNKKIHQRIPFKVTLKRKMLIYSFLSILFPLNFLFFITFNVLKRKIVLDCKTTIDNINKCVDRTYGQKWRQATLWSSATGRVTLVLNKCANPCINHPASLDGHKAGWTETSKMNFLIKVQFNSKLLKYCCRF